MDIKNFNVEGEWLELKAASKELGVLKFKVVPRDSDMAFDLTKMGKTIARLIIDWDLKENEKPVPCTEEMKKKWMPHLVMIKLESDGEESEETEAPSMLGKKYVGGAIIDFAQTIDNFLKN